MKNIKNWKPWKQNLLLSSIAVFVTLIICEVILRNNETYASYAEQNGGKYAPAFQVQHTGWLYQYSPFYTRDEIKIEFTHHVRANSLGFNDKEPILDSNKINTFIIGDSFGEGLGATHADSTISRILENLNQNIKTSNFSLSGSDPFYAWILIREKLIEMKPDMIIHLINRSDINDIMIRGGFERFNPDTTVTYREGPSWELVYEYCYFFRLVVHTLLGFDYDLIKKNDRQQEISIAKEKLENCINSINAISRDNSIRYIVVFHPTDIEIIGHHSFLFDSTIDKLKDKIEIINMMSYFKQQGMNAENVHQYYWPIDMHHNNRGYALFTRGIIKYLDSTSVVGGP